jgi:hypothetical protein
LVREYQLVVVIHTLKGFGDESADAKKERVFAVAAVFGTEDEWADAIRPWLRRTRGLPFHATDCEAYHPDKDVHDANLKLYYDLTQILVKSHLVGFAVTLNLVTYKEIFKVGPPDWAYFKALADVIGAAARTAKNFNNLPGDENVRLEFTFDSRLESNGTAGTMYTMLASQPEWEESGIFHTKIVFEGGPGKTPRLEMGDLLAREAMKEVDRKITNARPKKRGSLVALEETKKFHFIERDREYWEELRNMVQKPESGLELMKQWDQWLLNGGRVNPDGTLARTMNNWFLFNAWLDNQDAIKKKKKKG